MTRDDIIRMAREAGLEVFVFDGVEEIGVGDGYHIQTDLIERFAALVAALQQEHDAELSAALGWPGGISDPVLDRKTLLRKVAELRAALAQEPAETWVCPEAPEVRYDKPGPCWDCGKPLVLAHNIK